MILNAFVLHVFRYKFRLHFAYTEIYHKEAGKLFLREGLYISIHLMAI